MAEAVPGGLFAGDVHGDNLVVVLGVVAQPGVGVSKNGTGPGCFRRIAAVAEDFDAVGGDIGAAVIGGRGPVERDLPVAGRLRSGFGANGTVAGVAESVAAAPSPWSLTARTSKSYSVPLVRPAMLAVSARPTPIQESGNVPLDWALRYS